MSFEAGLTLGPAHRPDEYRLLQRVKAGGEGEVWRAERTDRDGARDLCAVKILRPHGPRASEEEIERWRARWEDSAVRANQLSVPGLVVPLCFVGAAPHPPGAPGGGQVPYLVSRWVDGPQLQVWAQESAAAPAERLDVLVRLCRIVDELHDLGWAHRDISHANVLVDAAGRPHLIDLTFLARLDRPLRTRVGTPGFGAAEEERLGAPPSTAKDAFSVGALARILLVPDARIRDTARVAALTGEELEEAGYSTAAVDWLLRALDPDPAGRPSPLTPWAERLRELVAAGPAPRHGCLSLTADARDRPVVVTGGPQGLRRWSTSAEPSRLTGGGPQGVRAVAVVRDGAGRLVTAALDRYEMLWLGTEADGWEQVRYGARGLATLVSPFGEALIWTAQATGLCLLRLRPDGGREEQTVPDVWPARVLTAAWDADGTPAVVVAEEGRVTHWTWPLAPGAGPGPSPSPSPGPVPAPAPAPAPVPVPVPVPATMLAAGARQAALAVNHWGELTARLLDASGLVHPLTRHFSGVWEPDGAPAPGTESLLVTLRGGRGGAQATPDGLAVDTGAHAELLGGSAASLPALHLGRDGRLLAAAVIDGDQVCCWQEDWDGSWQPVPLVADRP
ncbi:serine/threonine protein kinase [Kitasatospora sp. NPDC048407]|uniref:serine/threonine protein kinase n=1 Tax=Kitasatospora sp. NPDC048407 TaxID=3364051 RepID=UPI0037177B10